MPGPRNLPARSSQRRIANQQDEPPMRTRSGREPKSAARPDKQDMVSPKASSHRASTTPLTRKTTRAASNTTNYADLDNGSEIYAIYQEPVFTVFGLSREFFDTLKEPKISKKRRLSDLPSLNALFTHSDSMSEEDMESDEEPSSPHPAPRGRGRGGRGSRGGRGRGGRGRGSRGGRARAPAARFTSPLRTRPSRNAAPAFPLVEEDDDEPSNQDSGVEDAKPSPDSEEEGTSADEEHQGEEEEDDAFDAMEDVKQDLFVSSKTPPGSPPPELIQAYRDPDVKIPVQPAVPKISLTKRSVSRTQTPKEGNSTPAVSAVPKLLAPEDDVLSDSDLPEPWLEGLPSPDRSRMRGPSRLPPPETV
ncbi:hypothetical protein N0V90_005291 [Kalmusia sp. IMI 367209]|nr:hypothetical protein N0V90_005291 [Kalmusia sp. IMI 367209]